MKKSLLLNLAVTTNLLLCHPLSALADKLGESVAGFTLRDGVYQPNEPYREGQPRVTGLQQAFPRMPSIDENPLTPAKVELGKLLYFDPILSGENTISCATVIIPISVSPMAEGRAWGLAGKVSARNARAAMSWRVALL